MSFARYIDHIAIAVRSIDRHLSVYYDMGLQLDGIETVESQNVRVAFLSTPEGKTRIELVEPLSDNSPVSRFLERFGEKLHHICFRTNDLKQVIQILTEQGYRWIHNEPVPGAGQACIAFLHPSSTQGTLIEFKQPIPETRAD